ncbi:hypothetical protein JKP88DRAFT_242496 [Tribonema minus]|uniref:J domain-containing protein n=1 Tax=Tribonema minus TaxID=303371 RepID=A0A835YHK9_9STRA|nr:hypothetical protein JKP88DRAFT_242496 [Tribonema minus]
MVHAEDEAVAVDVREIWGLASKSAAAGHLHEAVLWLIRLKAILAAGNGVPSVSKAVALVAAELALQIGFLRENAYVAMQIDPALCTPAFVKKRYKRLALAYHPDKNLGVDTTELFGVIRDAFDVLRDAGARTYMPAQSYESFMQQRQMCSALSREPKAMDCISGLPAFQGKGKSICFNSSGSAHSDCAGNQQQRRSVPVVLANTAAAPQSGSHVAQPSRTSSASASAKAHNSAPSRKAAAQAATPSRTAESQPQKRQPQSSRTSSVASAGTALKTAGIAVSTARLRELERRLGGSSRGNRASAGTPSACSSGSSGANSGSSGGVKEAAALPPDAPCQTAVEQGDDDRCSGEAAEGADANADAAFSYPYHDDSDDDSDSDSEGSSCSSKSDGCSKQAAHSAAAAAAAVNASLLLPLRIKKLPTAAAAAAGARSNRGCDGDDAPWEWTCTPRGTHLIPPPEMHGLQTTPPPPGAPRHQHSGGFVQQLRARVSPPSNGGGDGGGGSDSTAWFWGGSSGGGGGGA